jgi:uncharacterized membrane protein (UPF0127 family)
MRSCDFWDRGPEGVNSGSPGAWSGMNRFDSSPLQNVAGHEVPVALGFRARLLGLAYLDREAAGPGLLIPRCAAVHTFGMSFPLDLYFLGADGEILDLRRAVPPRRFVSHRGAAAVLEVPT